MANPLAVILRASGASSVAGSDAGVDISVIRSAAKLSLVVTAIVGTLTVTVETSPDGVSGWRAVDAFPVVAAVDLYTQAFAKLDRWVRVSWTHSVGGSATFGVYGDAHQLFVTEGDVTGTELTAKAIVGVAKADIALALITGSCDVYDAVASAYTVPIISVGQSAKQRGAAIAAFHIMKHRGFKPQTSDELIVAAKADAESWLNRVAQGKIRPPDIVDSTPQEYEGGAVVVSDPPREW